ncbi:MAG: TetR/AcrR family transcriptional regulator [Deltaproteobacteria bacterium]|nr:TetR/AcrR family transcriptional regulator [Deltaproteobacteria bacterium]MBW2418720.1 TetR/AcrR family transcriptional regulator [Deltaproteobacteria bacterium]
MSENPGLAAGLNPRTRERILDGAVRAVARHGLAKLGMSDVSESAGVSRGTLYRYFPNREVLLDAVAVEEGQRFFARVLEAVEAESEGEARMRVMLEHATRHVVEHEALQRLLVTEPGYLLESLREQYPAIRAAIEGLLAPLLRDTEPVRGGIATAEQLADWTTRFMISAFLFPAQRPEDMSSGILSMFRMLRAEPLATHGDHSTPTTSTPTTPPPTTSTPRTPPPTSEAAPTRGREK